MEILLTSIVSAFFGIIGYIATRAIDKDAKIKEEVREIQRKRFEEFIEEMEEALQLGLIYIKSPEKKNEVEALIHAKLNKLTWKMFISAPDEVIRKINESFSWEFTAIKRRDIYFELRKNLLWKTSLNKEDLLWWSKNWNYE